MIDIKNLNKKYGNRYVLKDLNMEIKEGDIYGLIGKNGAGKSTLMKIILGLSKADSGYISIFNSENVAYNLFNIGSLIEEPSFFPELSANENLRLFDIAFGLNTKKFDEILSLVGLENDSSKKVKNFSLGMKKRLGLAISLLGSPKLIILDEPTNGLDPKGIIELRELIKNLNQEKKITFLISSHILEELSKVATVFGYLDDGQIKKSFKNQNMNHKMIFLNVDKPKIAYNLLINLYEESNLKLDVNGVYLETKLFDKNLITRYLSINNVNLLKVEDNSIQLEGFFMEDING